LKTKIKANEVNIKEQVEIFTSEIILLGSNDIELYLMGK